ncbi:MAG TPA: DUF2752 domain-containing protein [Chitinophagales bacterium]|nr:DUF2752 domain-containing protein [Chitinophagales bacterium]
MLKSYLQAYKIAISIIVYNTAAITLFTLWDVDIRIPCLWRIVSGCKCWGCGLSEAAGYLLKFDFAEAYHSNALIYPILIVAAAYFVNHFLSFAYCYYSNKKSQHTIKNA